MKKLFLIVILGLAAFVASPEIKQQGNAFIEQSQSRESKPATKTEYVYIDSKGESHPIYVSSNGKAFVVLTSKKTGKQYKKYLPEVTKCISKPQKKEKK